MHLLYVIDSLVPGGAEQSLAALAPHYTSAGVRLDVAYLHRRPGLQAQLEEAGAALFCLDAPGGRLAWVRRVASLVRARAPQLLHTTLFEADVAGRIAGVLTRVPVVSSLVNPEYGPDQLSDPRLKAWKVRGAQLVDAATARGVVRFHAVSEYVAGLMARRLLIRRTKIDVVPRGRDAERLGRRTPERRADARSALGAGRDTALVLAAARQEYQKGLDVLLEAFPSVLARVPGAALVVAGREGNHSPALRETVERLRLGEAVRFVGSRSDLPELLCAADAFAVPSRWEGLPGAVIEAMALEAPIVASDIPPVREVVGDEGSAALVPPDRPAALAEALVRTLSDAGAAATRARVARDRFLARHTMERVAEGMMRFYDRALAGRRRFRTP